MYYLCGLACVLCHSHSLTSSKNKVPLTTKLRTGWRRPVECRNFCERSTKYRTLLRKVTYEEKGSEAMGLRHTVAPGYWNFAPPLG